MAERLMKVGKVELQRLIGRGETAEVYLGLHTSLNRLVAVKIMHSHLVDQTGLIDRFKQEAEAVAKIRHPNIVTVYDFDSVDGRPCLVMEYVAGVTLDQYISRLEPDRNAVSSNHATIIASGLADALHLVHAQGIVHRDVKSGNIMLRSASEKIVAGEGLPEDVQPVLMDFGVAHLMDASIRTATGVFMGTPAYMSPEQVLGGEVDARTDIYSLGVVLFEMLEGYLPFDPRRDTPTSVFYKHINTPFPRLSPENAKLQRVVDKCLAKDRLERYGTAEALEEDLQSLMHGSDWPRRVDSFLKSTALNLPLLRTWLLEPDGNPDHRPVERPSARVGSNSTEPSSSFTTHLNTRILRSGLLTASSESRPSRRGLRIVFGALVLFLLAGAGIASAGAVIAMVDWAELEPLRSALIQQSADEVSSKGIGGGSTENSHEPTEKIAPSSPGPGFGVGTFEASGTPATLSATPSSVPAATSTAAGQAHSATPRNTSRPTETPVPPSATPQPTNTPFIQLPTLTLLP